MNGSDNENNEQAQIRYRGRYGSNLVASSAKKINTNDVQKLKIKLKNNNIKRAPGGTSINNEEGGGKPSGIGAGSNYNSVPVP